MAYGDTVDPKSRVISAVLVGVITFLLGWLLVSGLAIKAVEKLIEKLDVIEIEEPPPPEVPPPPPPPDNKLPPPPRVTLPPPLFAPISDSAPRFTPPPPPQQQPTPYVAPPPVVAAPSQARGPQPRGRDSTWVTTDDYPSSAIREESEGTTATRLSIGADGRVTSCDVTSSSGNSSLDQAACRNLIRRARFDPALDRDGNPISSSFSKRVRWVLPDR